MANPYESPTFRNSLSLRVDGAIGAMSLSPNGRDAVLAGRRGLFIIDLDDPFKAPRWLHHITSWEVADVQWSPHHGAKPSWCISTSNQKALLWDLARPSNNAIQNVLHKHTRAITDINFHPLDPELLATCSIDTFVYSWDMRAPRRPVGKWAEWRAGATQVKWNPNNPFQICSSHHHSFYLWDSRKGAIPLLKIENAHRGKINGLSFNRTNDHLISCANDNTVKFWDLSSASCDTELQPTVSINTDYPVARARSIPFGRDNCCGLMPVRGGGDAVHVVNYKAAYERARSLGETAVMDAVPDYSFKGHNGSIKDFLWRIQHGNYEGFESKHRWKEYQLVTWSSQDFDLKLWPTDEKLNDVVNYNPLHQNLLNSLLTTGERSDMDTQVGSPASSPESELSEEAALKKPIAFKYSTYSTEPSLSLGDLAKETNGDTLSTYVLYKIKQSEEHHGGSTQLNHLNWISGVRMGRSTLRKGNDQQNSEEDDGPSNLGEEVSIVGHKFPKIRFEKISVSTGHIVLSLRGPLSTGSDNSSSESEEKDGKESIEEPADQPNPSNAAATAAAGPPTVGTQNTQPGATHAAGQNIPSQNIPTIQPPSNGINLLPKAGTNRPVPPTPSAPAGNNAADTTANTTATANETSQEQKLIFIRLEIRFPKMYPFLEEAGSKHSKRSSRQRKSQQIKFDIEETHELTPKVKKEMLANLDNIAQFYTNKYNKFCLEPCLRFLLGDKIELDDSLMLESANNTEVKNMEELDTTIEVGNEGWVDDLIDQHEAAEGFLKDMSVSGDEEDDYDGDIIPAVNETLVNSGEFPRDASNPELGAQGLATGGDGNLRHDSTPIPKGCGAYWSRTGQLVCFFIPKANEHEQENKTLQKFSIMNFTDNGFGLKSSQHHNSGSETAGRAFDHNISDHEDGGLLSSCHSGSGSDDDSKSSNSEASDDSFSNDWDELLEDDIPSRSRIPGMFGGSVGLGRRLLARENGRDSMNRTISGRGTGSNYKSSLHDDSALRSTRKVKTATGTAKNIVCIFDFRHLIPDKYELACDYRVLGDAPDNLARHNFNVALQHGYRDIANVWKIVEMILTKDVRLNDVPDIGKDLMYAPNDLNGRFYWGNHPFGHSWLVKELFQYFEKGANLQMLAMLSCILFENLSNIQPTAKGMPNVPIQTPYSALPPRPTLAQTRAPTFLYSESDTVFSQNVLMSPIAGYAASRKNSSLSGKELLLSRLIPNSLEQPMRSESPGKIGSLRKLFPGSNSYTNVFPLDQSNLKNSKSLEGIKKIPKGPVARKPSRSNQFKRGPTLNTGTPTNMRQKALPTVTIEMKNLGEVDLFDHVFSSPLLGGLDPAKILSYRSQYADMLYSWGLPFHRIKILKFNYPEEQHDSYSSSSTDIYKCNFGLRYRKAQSPNQQLLTPITEIATAKNNAWNTRKRSKLQYCSLCGLLITKRIVICTKCEHVLHSHCAASWWAVESEEEPEESLECPTGCGCQCLSHTI